MNSEVIDQLEVREGHAVLEVGSGPGDALKVAAARARGGQVVGIDVSDVMVKLALHRNRRAVARGEVTVRAGDIAALDLEGARFDRIFSVHSIYFWRDVDAVLTKLANALRAEGKLILAVRPHGSAVPARFRDPVYRFPRIEAIEAALIHAGLTILRSDFAVAEPEVVLVVATKPPASAQASLSGRL